MSKHHRNRARTRATPAKQDQASFTTETRSYAWTSLTDLADELQVLDDYIAPSHEGPPVSQMSAETNARVGALMARERAERFGYGRKKTGARDPWGLDIIYPIGASQSPTRVTSLDASAHAHAELVQLELRIARSLRMCPVGPADGVHAASRAMRIRSWLPHIVTAELLADVDTTGYRLLRYVTQAIDGDPSTRLDAPCPYCDRKTLVAYPRRGIIRCDRPSTQHCRCQAEGCPCSEGQRHTWRRDHGQWSLLASLLEQRANERAFITRIAACALLAAHGQMALLPILLAKGPSS